MGASARVVKDVIDASGIYFSRAAAADGWIFLSSPPVDETGVLAPEAIPESPYGLSPAAHARAQTKYVFDRFGAALDELGAGFEDICQVEQYVPWKAFADGYIEVSRGPGFLERNRPGSALMQSGDLMPDGVKVMPTGIAMVPSDGRGKEIYSSNLSYATGSEKLGDSYAEEAPFSEIVAAGPYVFTTIWPSDYHSGIHPDAKVDQWVWWGSEIRSEAEWAASALATKLGVVGSDVSNAVHCTVHLTDIGDLYDLDLVWREVWPENPPARTVVPIRGLGSPRREGVHGHGDAAMRNEMQFRSTRPGFGVEAEHVNTDLVQLGHETQAVKAGPLVWISGQLAADEDGLVTAPDAVSQVRHIFDRIERIAEAAGSGIDRLLRLRAYVVNPADGYAVYSVLKERVPADPPCVCVAGVPGPLQVPECTVLIDAVACEGRSA